MRIIDFPACCTASIIHGFGESRHAMGDNTSWGFVNPDSSEAIAQFFLKCIKRTKAEGESMITVITNSQQHKANKALRVMGFKHSTWLTKPNHNDATLRLWWVDVQTWKMPEKKVKVTTATIHVV